MEFDKRDFKIALIRTGKTIKDFCREHDIDYSIFNLAINNQTFMKPEFKEAIDNFVSNSSKSTKTS